MATPTRPCPFCGQQVLVAASHCGYCGRPLPQQAAPQPQKTMMGYAPQNLGKPGAPAYEQQPPAGPPPPAPPQAAVPPAAQTPPMFGVPPQQPPGYAALPQQPPGYGAPPQQPPGYGAPPQAPYGAPPQQQAPYGQPPQQPYGAPPQQPYGAPPQQQYGAPPQQYGGGYGPPPGAPAWMNKLPNKPGTLFGIPLHLLRNQRFERTVLAAAAIVLFVTRFLPIMKAGDWVFPFSRGVPKFAFLVYPILAALVYAFVAMVPAHVRAKVPPALLRWAPFIVAYFGTGYLWAAMPAGFLALMSPVGIPGSYAVMAWSFPILVFGLICRLENPEDNIARVLIAIGAFGALIGGLVNIGDLFELSHAPALLVIHNLLFFIIILAMVASIVYAIPTQWWPQVRALDPFLPLVTAVLIIWAPLAAVLIALAIPGVGNKLFLLIQMLSLQIGFYLVLMCTAPQAVDSLKRMLASRPQPPQPWQGPPPGNYPPPG